MSKLNWAKVEQERKMSYRPAPRSRPATQKQLDYICGLAVQKGQSKPSLPKTLKGASDLIERLLTLPDVAGPFQPMRLVTELPRVDATIDLRTELDERYPSLSPATIRALIHLFNQVDDIGTAFFFEALAEQDAPEEPEALVMHIMAEFVAWVRDV